MKRILSACGGLAAVFLPAWCMAQGAVAEVVEEGVAAPVMGGTAVAWIAVAAGFSIAIASFGGAIGQGKVAATAMEGISRNPDAASKVMTPMIIALALIESLVIYALVIAFLLQGKI